jgi:hypothetical protein
MPCQPFSVSLEVDPPNTNQQILFSMAKTCNPDDSATWTLYFELKQGNPLATVVKLNVTLTKAANPQAEVTAKNGLNSTQQGLAKLAAATCNDPNAPQHLKDRSVEKIVTSRELESQAGGA